MRVDPKSGQKVLRVPKKPKRNAAISKALSTTTKPGSQKGQTTASKPKWCSFPKRGDKNQICCKDQEHAGRHSYVPVDIKAHNEKYGIVYDF